MNKTYFHTYDIFNHKNKFENLEWFRFCRNKALISGLDVKDIINESNIKLELHGTRFQFIKYYFRTLTKCENKLNGIIRFILFLT